MCAYQPLRPNRLSSQEIAVWQEAELTGWKLFGFQMLRIFVPVSVLPPDGHSEKLKLKSFIR